MRIWLCSKTALPILLGLLVVPIYPNGIAGSKSNLLASTNFFGRWFHYHNMPLFCHPMHLADILSDWHSGVNLSSPVFFSLRTDSSSSEKVEVRRVSLRLWFQTLFHCYHNPQHGRYVDMNNCDQSRFHPHTYIGLPLNLSVRRRDLTSYYTIEGIIIIAKGC